MKTDVWPRAVAFATLVLLPATAFAQAPIGVIGIAREVASVESRFREPTIVTAQRVRSNRRFALATS
jgi:hypothetical protein